MYEQLQNNDKLHTNICFPSWDTLPQKLKLVFLNIYNLFAQLAVAMYVFIDVKDVENGLSIEVIFTQI